MNYRLGITVERPEGGWLKVDIELEQADLQLAAQEFDLIEELDTGQADVDWQMNLKTKATVAQAKATEILILDLMRQGLSAESLKGLVETYGKAKAELA